MRLSPVDFYMIMLLTSARQCLELSGNGHSDCLIGVVLLSELPHKCAHVWVALTVSSDFTLFCDLPE